MRIIDKALVITLGVVAAACSQEFQEPVPNNQFKQPVISEPYSSGDADFSKFVAVGNSLTAGFQAGALFTDGQETSVPNIMALSFEEVGGGDFNQPDINSENGFLGFGPNGEILGRLLLMGDPPVPTPTLGDLPAPYTGDKSQLNNFGVPGILLGQALITNTGTPDDPLENPLYTRFASDPGNSTIIGDAVAAQGTFFLFWLGNNDVLGYAVSGASNEAIFTDPADFEAQYQAAMGALTADPNIKGVVCNIPDVTAIPFFKLIPWNTIPLDAATASALNFNFDGVNQAAQGAAANGLITNDELELRLLEWKEGNNGLLIWDEELFDLSALGVPPEFGKVRLTNQNDQIPLTAGTVIGTLADPDNPNSKLGVAVPLDDKYALTATEVTVILNRTDNLNAIIKSIVDGLNAGGTRVGLVDINTRFNLLVQVPSFENGVMVTAELSPPFGGFSEDGVHPNSRGYALAARWIIENINTTFNANVPLPDLSQYSGTGLPITN